MSMKSFKSTFTDAEWTFLLKNLSDSQRTVLIVATTDPLIPKNSETVNVPLTSNQLAVLLQVYRGVDDSVEHKRGNYITDLRYLYRQALVYFDGEVCMTPKGTLRVMQVLE